MTTNKYNYNVKIKYFLFYLILLYLDYRRKKYG